MSRRRNNPEWSDPTATEAIQSADTSRKKKKKRISITEHRRVEPLSKFNDPSDWKGRHRLLRDLNKRIEATPKKDHSKIKDLFKERDILEALQHASRVSAEDFNGSRMARRLALHSKPS